MQFEIPGWQHAAENPNDGRARVVYESKLEAAKQARQHEAQHANSVSGNLPVVSGPQQAAHCRFA
jgi:hypothetical protein